MARIPELIQSAKFGGAQIRSPLRQQTAGVDKAQTLAQARSAYETMRQDNPADDITPELFLYSAMYEFHAFDEMKVIVAEMRRRQLGNQDVEALDTG